MPDEMQRHRHDSHPLGDQQGDRYPDAGRRGDRSPGRHGYGYPYVDDLHEDGGERNNRSELWLALCAGALLGTAGAVWYARHRTEEERRRHPPDSAPARAMRPGRGAERPPVGRTVTIGRPRAEVYAYWRDFSNLASFMEQVESVEPSGEGSYRWHLVTPAIVPGEREFVMETRILDDVENESLSWRTTEGSDIEAEGEVRFRDAPGERGTEIEATVRYAPPGGRLGRLAIKLFGLDPKTQIRHELKRLKMLLETGEIATSVNRVADARSR